MIWFGRLSVISQLARRVGGEGELGKNLSMSLHYPGSRREAGMGVGVPPLEYR